ncbi:MAG: hypothetical protein ACRD4T_13220 [Candidatus Acidiferrales bacterium]
MTDTLKSICGQCVHLNNPQLDFVPAELLRHREIIVRDLGELVSAASLELEKTVVILSGSILEAVLYSFLQAQESYIAQRRGTFTFDPEQSLENYVSIFNKWFSDALPQVVIPDFVIGYRNIVHVNRELNSVPGVCGVASRDMLRLLDALLGELSSFAGGATEQVVISS